MRLWLALAFAALAFSAHAARDFSRISVSAIVPGACAVTVTSGRAVCAATPSPAPRPTVTLTHDASGAPLMTITF
jgi:hypothetical protein